MLDCQKCARLTVYRNQQKLIHPEYHCLPVASFGARDAQLLIVGLAPGLHGANATGRPFTGDASGDMLFRTLHKFRFSSLSVSRSNLDKMQLFNCRITNAIKCVPPQNHPNGDEITTCNAYLREEITQLQPGAVILALGGTAHRSVLKALALPQVILRFGHLAECELPVGLTLVDSYHCSRYNTNTGRLSQAMFEKVFQRIRRLLQ
ncbi:MAG: uracil-DNA glycosylase [Gammaproteobacteria bacterium]|nr:uracil-DNA glycosylase [Gammaproteobacteria bacterium]